MQTLRQDISHALRQMRLSPVFTLTAMLTLALGIGATTAIFSLIHSVMLKSLPVADPSSIYRVEGMIAVSKAACKTTGGCLIHKALLTAGPSSVKYKWERGPTLCHPEWIWARARAPKVIKNTFCLATALNGNIPLPFVIPSAAEDAVRSVDHRCTWKAPTQPLSS